MNVCTRRNDEAASDSGENVPGNRGSCAANLGDTTLSSAAAPSTETISALPVSVGVLSSAEVPAGQAGGA